MNDSIISPELQNYPLGYQLTESFKAAVLAGDASRAIALVGLMREAPEMFLLRNGGERGPLMITLDPHSHPGLPVDVDLVQALLDAGAPVNAPMPGRPSPLLFAVLSGSLPVVDLLLEAGADARYEVGDWIWTPGDTKSLLVRAIEAGQSAIALRLLEAGADPHGSPVWPRPLQAAARVGDADVALALIERGADVNAQFPDTIKPEINGARYSPSTTALIEAAGIEGNPVLALLLEKGARADARSDIGQSALHAACSRVFSHPRPGADNARRLIAAGADPNARDKWGGTPIFGTAQFSLASRRTVGDEEVPGDVVHALLRLLLDHGADPNTVGLEDKIPGGVSILAEVLSNRDIGSVLLLLRAGASLTNVDAGQLWLLARESQDTPHQELTAMLQAQGLAPNASEQAEALQDAAYDGELARVRLLLENGTSPNSPGKNGESPLLVAAEQSHFEVVEELLRRGADIDVRLKNGNTPLHLVALGGSRSLSSAEETLATQQEIRKSGEAAFGTTDAVWKITFSGFDWLAERNAATTRVLLSAGADVHAVNNSGNTPLHLAAQHASPAVVEMLLNAGASVDASNANARTPLHELLAYSQRQKLLKSRPETLGHGLLQPSASMNAYLAHCVRGSHFLLQHAVSEDLAILRLLLKCGANVNKPGFAGYLPLHLSAIFGTPEIVALLVDAGADATASVHGYAPHYTPLDSVFGLGRTQTLLKEAGFTSSDFPGITAELRGAALDPNFALDRLLSRGTLSLQAAAREDVAILRVLLQAGASMS